MKRVLMKQIVALLVAIALLGVEAATQKIGDRTWTYSVENRTETMGRVAIIEGVSPATGSIEVPQTLGGCPVTDIGDSAFEDSEITSVKVPNGVIWIGDGAFSYCLKLQSVELPSSVWHLGANAFANCRALINVKYDGKIGREAYIDYGAFKNCSSLTNLLLPHGVSSIG